MSDKPGTTRLLERGVLSALLAFAVVVGLLAGLADTAAPYVFPSLAAQWQNALPASWSQLTVFVAFAVVTDLALVLVAAFGIGIPLSLIARITRIQPASLATVGKTLLLGGAACYLLNGWVAMSVLATGHDQSPFVRVCIGLGSLVLLVLAGVICRRLSRRRTRYAALRGFAPAALVLAALTGVRFATQPNQAQAARSPARMARPHPNIVLITLDTLRRDFVGCYGNPWIRTPALDALAADGVVFDAAISQAPSTTPSHCSIMTGVYPVEHGAVNGRPMDPRLVTLADVLRSGGYRTAAFTSATTTRSINTGLQRGFERYSDSLVPWSELFGRDELQHLIFFYLVGFSQYSQLPGRVVTARATRWLEQRGETPFFVWLHYFDAHQPFGSPAPFRGMYAGQLADVVPMRGERERYAEDVSYVDHQLGRILAELKRRRLYDDALIVVTSDHGEAFGEWHDKLVETGHGLYLSDVTQRVPLIVKPPRSRRRGTRIARQVELIDLAPTILDWVGLHTPAQMHGASRVADLNGEAKPGDERFARAFCTVHVAADSGSRYVEQLAIRTGRWKYVTRPELRESELYDLRTDPDERENVLAHNRPVADELFAKLLPYCNLQSDAARDPRAGVSPALLRELHALGYLDSEGDD